MSEVEYRIEYQIQRRSMGCEDAGHDERGVIDAWLTAASTTEEHTHA